jgi:murein DD-endopeptidase MepM/ murein hydrolase activator NlpD
MRAVRSARIIAMLVIWQLLGISSLWAAPPNLIQGASSNILMPDDRFTYEPNFTSIEIQNFLQQEPGILKSYRTKLGDLSVPAAQAIDDASIGMLYSVNPKILLTLLEIKVHLISNPSPLPELLDHPFGAPHSLQGGLQPELAWISTLMQNSYQSYIAHQQQQQVVFADGTIYTLPSSPNAATFALQTALAQLSTNEAEFLHLIDQNPGSFLNVFQRFFGDPQSMSLHVAPSAITPFLYKPLSGTANPGSFLDHNGAKNLLRRFDGITNFSYDNHSGTDFPKPSGTPVLAAANGTILTVRINYTEGTPSQWCSVNYSPVTGIVIRHVQGGEEFKTSYWHFSPGAIAVNPRTGRQFAINDQVLKGDVIGYSGTTGCSTGPHLHFGVDRAGKAVDPYGWCGQGADPWPNANEVLWAEAITNPSPCPTQISAPEGWIDAPPHGSTQSGTVRIGGWSRVSGSTISRVEIWIDGVNRGNAIYGTYRSDPSLQANVGYYWDWNTTQVGNGAHSIQAKAFAVNGTSTTLSANGPNNTHTINVLNDTTPPTGNITSPTDNTLTNNPNFTINASASDNIGINRVEFNIYYDGTWHSGCTDTSAPYSCAWNASAVTDQDLIFTIHVIDNAGLRTVDPGGYRHVRLDRAPPTATIAALEARQTNDLFTVEWGGSDNLSGVTGYDLDFTDNGGVWLNHINNQNRTSTTFTGSDGHSYTFRVRARDAAGNLGNYAVSNATTVQVTQPDSYENDNSSATPSLLGHEQQHNFHAAGDVDWVMIYVNANMPYSLRTSNLDVNTDTVIDLYDLNLNWIDGGDDWQICCSTRLNILRPTSGFLYAKVQQYGSQFGANTAYTLIFALGDAYEYDDSTGDPIALAQLSATQHTAHVPGDRDSIVFDTPAGIPYTLLTTNLGNTSDTILDLQTSSGSVTNDDTLGLGLGSRIDFYADAGINSAWVRQFNPNAYGPDTSYTLLLAQGDDYEHDNSSADATPLPSDGTLLPHTIHVPGDVDWHKLYLTTGNHYAITTQLDGSSADVIFKLYDSNGTTLLTQNTAYNPVVGWAPAHTGYYYLESRAWHDTTYGSVQLTGYRVSARIDNQVPTGGLSAPHYYTNSPTMTLQLSGSDQGSGLYQMQFASYSDSAGRWVFTDWMAYQDTYDYSLSNDEGYRLIWVHYRDRADNYSDWAWVDVIYDRQSPTVDLQHADPASDWNGLFLSWSAEDTLAGIDTFTLQWSKNGGAWQETLINDPSATGTLFFGDPGASYQFTLRAVDLAGNSAVSPLTSAVSFPGCGGDTAEPDDTSATARVQPVPGSSAHTICRKSDTDWIALPAIAGRTYTIETQDLRLADTVLKLYAPDATTVITSNDDLAMDNLASRIVWKADRSATYYVSVRDFSAETAGDGVSYALAVRADGPQMSHVYLPLALYALSPQIAAAVPDARSSIDRRAFKASAQPSAGRLQLLQHAIAAGPTPQKRVPQPLAPAVVPRSNDSGTADRATLTGDFAPPPGDKGPEPEQEPVPIKR